MKKRTQITLFLITVSMILVNPFSAMNFASVTATKSTGLVGYWNFEDGTDTIVDDSSGNGNDGVLYGTPTWVTGPFGNALEFSGDDYIIVEDSDSLDINTGALTIELWVNAYKTGGGDDPGPVIVNKYWPESYYLQLLFDSQIEFGAPYGGDTMLQSDPGSFTKNEWTHVAGIFDGETDTIAIYVNGVLVKSANTLTDVVGNSDYDLLIGGDYFEGILDEVKIWNRALTADEIKRHARANGVVYKAQGSWEEYDPYDVHAEVVGGHWNIEIKIVNGEPVVQWESQYRELNLGGEGSNEYDQAVGTIDHFKYYFSEIYSVSISEDSCILEVNLMVHAKHHDPETGKPYWHWLDYGYRVIDINQDRIITGTLTGPTHTIKY